MLQRNTKRLAYKLAALLMVAAFLFTTGCAVVSPEHKRFTQIAPPQSGKSLVYFYRPFNILGGSWAPSINDNNKKILGALPMRTYWIYEMEPGEHTFSPKILLGLYKKGPLTINNDKPGKVYYVKMVVSIGYIGFQEMSEEQGKLELQRTFRMDS